MPRRTKKGAKPPSQPAGDTATAYEAEWTRPDADGIPGGIGDPTTAQAATATAAESTVTTRTVSTDSAAATGDPIPVADASSRDGDPGVGAEPATAELERLRRELEDAQSRAQGVLEVERLRRELAEANEKADRYHSNWQRSAADFQNWKRRTDQEKVDAQRLAEASLTGELLRVLDDFERAFQSLPPELRRLTWIEGVALIGQKLFTILQSRGLTPIEAVDQEFDPHVHEAVMREEDGDPSEQTSVVAELQRGYRFHDRVIRPTLVKVGKPKVDDGGQNVPTAESEGSPL